MVLSVEIDSRDKDLMNGKWNIPVGGEQFFIGATATRLYTLQLSRNLAFNIAYFVLVDASLAMSVHPQDRVISFFALLSW
jgi:hypothetical protein